MANTNTEAKVAMMKLIASAKTKFAELDVIDNEFADLDAITPEGEGIEQFNLLTDKREELEDEIRSMRERMQLISEWEKLKGSGWSDDVIAELNALDTEFAAIADGADASIDAMNVALPEAPMAPEAPLGVDAPVEPLAPEVPEVPADATAAPEVTDTPVDEPMSIETPDAPTEPVSAPVASKNAQIKQNSNYQLQDKKRSSAADLKKGDIHMANQPSKPSLKEKLAEVKSKREAISKEAKTRVASAWAIAKTMLPTAPATVQKAFAASLLNNTTKALTAALRQTAINAHNTKLAETFKEVHKVELNDLLEDPSVLNAEKKAVESEIKSDPKNAGAKKADDRKDAGPQPDKYDDGRDGSEPKDMDASKAAERPDAGEKPGQTVDLSDGKSAAAKKACVGKDCTGCKNPDCKGKKANSKKADGEEAPVEEPVAEAPAEETTEAPAEEAPVAEEAELPAELPEAVPENPEAEAAEILTDEKKEVLEEKIDEAQAAIKAIEQEILEEGSEEDFDLAKLDGEEEAFDNGLAEGEEIGAEGEFDLDGELGGEGEELDFSKVFDEGAMDEKVSSLANEGEEKHAGEEDDFFAPSAASSLEASMDDDGMADMHSMFAMQGADGDPLASLIAGLKTAEEVAGMSVVPSSTGEAADHFGQDEVSSDDRDNETDHEGDLWADAIEDITPEEQGAKRTTQDSTNELELPKAATLKKIRTAASDKKTRRVDVGDILFNDGF